MKTSPLSIACLSLLTFLSPIFPGHGGEGIITTLEAPLLSKPSLTSHVRQLVRKGEKIYIHNQHFQNGPLEINYDSSTRVGFFLINENLNGEGFYQTNDRNGKTAYISSRYVKLITNDIREFSQSITPYSPDPNDYRLEEPLPKNYPLFGKEKYRAIFSLSVGPDLKNNYRYKGNFSKENFSQQYGLDLRYSRKAIWDRENRFYFGGLMRGHTSQSRFTLSDSGIQAKESKSQIGIGPFLSYDPWRSEKASLTIASGILVNFDRTFVTQKLGDIEEERLFSSFTLTPFLSTYMHFDTIIPEVEFIIGTHTQLNLPHNLKASQLKNSQGVWIAYQERENTIGVPLSLQWAGFIGLQSNY